MALPSNVRQWLRYALDDLKIARTIGDMGSSYWRGSAYHSQQAVEKAIKGCLTFHKVRFAKTHDILILVNTLKTVDPALAQKLTRAKRLTKFAIEYRYPDAAEHPMTKAKAHSALRLAQECYEAISDRLRDF